MIPTKRFWCFRREKKAGLFGAVSMSPWGMARDKGIAFPYCWPICSCFNPAHLQSHTQLQGAQGVFMVGSSGFWTLRSLPHRNTLLLGISIAGCLSCPPKFRYCYIQMAWHLGYWHCSSRPRPMGWSVAFSRPGIEELELCTWTHIYTSGWWFGTCFVFPYIGNVIIPTDELIFFRGVGSTTNQMNRQPDRLLTRKPLMDKPHRYRNRSNSAGFCRVPSGKLT